MSCGLARMAPPAARHPPSDGAHRLAWWLAPRGDDGFEQIATAAGISIEMVDRLLSGDVEPGGEISIPIARETEGAVLPEDWLRGGPLGWLRGGPLGWLDRPHARPG